LFHRVLSSWMIDWRWWAFLPCHFVKARLVKRSPRQRRETGSGGFGGGGGEGGGGTCSPQHPRLNPSENEAVVTVIVVSESGTDGD